MNNRYIAYYAPRACKAITSLLCFTVLALAPACTKHQTKTKDVKKVEDINTMIELDDSIFELEEDVDVKKSIVKF